MRRLRSWILFGLLIALAGASFYYGNVIDLSAAGFRIGYGAIPRSGFDDTPFSIGPPQRYQEPGIYLDYVFSHGVYVVSHMGMIVALSAHDPATGKPVHYDPLTGQFSDPAIGARFTRDGLITGVNRIQRRVLNDPEQVKAALQADTPLARSMERCYIRRRGLRGDPDAELIVNPSHRFIFELNQWSREHCGYLLEQD